MDENREPLIFGDEEKIKPINQTSSFKGKSCFKKEKEKEKSKFAVKINAPDSNKKEENANEEVKERRKRRPQFKTVKEPSELKDKDLLNLKINKEDKTNKIMNKMKERNLLEKEKEVLL